jgi:hypothetical protein
MAHVHIPKGIPGILGPMTLIPQTAKPMNEPADILLRGPNSLAPGNHELTKVMSGSFSNC